MKHILLLLYFISYTSGIGAITLGVFYYVKAKDLSVKYAVIADVFFSVFLFFDTLNFYTDVIIGSFPTWLQITKIAGLMISVIGLIYCLTVSICYAAKVKITMQRKAWYIISMAVFMIIGTIALCVLHYVNLISEFIAIHSGFFLPNIFSSLGIAYDIFLIIRNWDKISSKVKQFIIIVIALAAIIVPISLLSNLIQYWHVFSIPVAYSPIEYFLINFLAIIFAKRRLQSSELTSMFNEQQDKKSVQDVELSLRPSSTSYLEELADSYGLTPRELEIIELVADGLTNQEISEKLFISANTARNHIYNIYRKLGIKSRYELIKLISDMSIH